MAEFINTIDSLGDDAVFDSIINRSITEFKDDRITSVREYAFSNCVNLTKVDIPSATTVGYNSFNGCTALAEVNIPAVTRIEAYNAFSTCRALKEIVLPSCSYIGQGAFSFCSKLEMADCAVTDSLYLGNNAFGSTTALKALVIRSNSVATMANKNALQESGIYYSRGYIYVPTALLSDDDATKDYRRATNWSDYANQFRKLEDFTVDGTVTGEFDTNKRMVRFFDEDGTLLYYTIVNSGEDAVYDGETPTKEGEWAFKGWSVDTTNVTADIDCYAQFKSTAVISRKIVERTLAGDYANDRVTTIANYAFYKSSKITSIDFPNATNIGNSAFYICQALASINLPNVTTVGESAFYYCKMTSINLPNVTTIGEYAFYNCQSLTKVDLPTLSVLKTYAFQRCEALETLILRKTGGICELWGRNALFNTAIATGTGYIYVPKASLDSYKNDSVWSYYSNQFRAIEDYPEICGGDN